jgi:hypothetical protein
MSRQYLMCRPTYFAVEYAINPWMNPDAPVDLGRAIAQWDGLVETHRRLGHTVELIEPVPGCRTWCSPPTAARSSTVSRSVSRSPTRSGPMRARRI